MQGMDLTISGHRVWIEYVKGQTKLEPWYKEPKLIVWIAVDSPHSVSGFGVQLPLKEYSREELKEIVEKEGTRRFNEIIIEQEEEKRVREEELAEEKATQEIARKVAEVAGVELLEDKEDAGIIPLKAIKQTVYSSKQDVAQEVKDQAAEKEQGE